MDTVESTFLKRISIFFGERFPLVLGFITTTVGTISLYLVWVAITDGAALIANKSLILGIISFFLLTLILRLCDEIKDKEVDAELFPERCLPSGKVKYDDIYKLLLGLAWVWIPLNYIFGGADIVFTILIFYVFLFYKYFFFPELISKNLLLALATHNPIMFLSSFYIVSLFSVDQGLSVWSIENLLLSLAFWMPSIGWETARKIRAPKDETEYTTYSKVLGPAIASAIPLLAAFIQMLCLGFVVKEMQYGFYFLLGNFSLFFLYFMVFLTFMVKKSSRIAGSLQQTTEAYILFTSILLIVISLLEIIK